MTQWHELLVPAIRKSLEPMSLRSTNQDTLNTFVCTYMYAYKCTHTHTPSQTDFPPKKNVHCFPKEVFLLKRQ